ncbi:translation initiation factor eIF3 subunit [Mycoemilia scoparia]|uniref:Eukaryotic translation initiation factor 3 subunit I n=1 Tax=Mycoemilia scoparia TaxID=417184 RepID=A0A9W8A780_9FUNG|nr:translation initiation factor eIF3 subunit [Mycoemilia scoparia]
MRPILLQGHTRPLTQIKYNKEGDLLFTVAKDKVVNVWYSHNGERLGTYDGHEGALWTLDVNTASTLLVTGAADNTARLWDVKTGKELHKWLLNDTAVRRVMFSKDEKYILCVTDKQMGNKPGIFVVSTDPETNYEVVKVIRDMDSKVTVAGWSYYDKYILAGHEDGTLTIYDWKNEDGNYIYKQVKGAHEGLITDLQLSTDGTYFITSGKDKYARLWDSSTLDCLKEYKADTSLNTASITPTQDMVVLGGGQAASEVTTTSSRQGKFESRFYHLIFETELGRTKGHFGPINTIAIHPKGKGFSSGGEDGYVRIHHFDPDYFKFNYSSVLLSISDHTTRTKIQNTNVDPVVFGFLLGALIDTNIVEIRQAAELRLDSKDGITSDDPRNIQVDTNFLQDRIHQLKQTYPDFEPVGWYITTSTLGFDDHIISIHKQVSSIVENPVVLLADLDFVTEANKTGRDVSIPIRLYGQASIVSTENVKSKGDVEGEKGSSTTPPIIKVDEFTFAQIPFNIELDQSESTVIDHISKYAGDSHYSVSLPSSALDSDPNQDSITSGPNGPRKKSNMSVMISTQKSAIDMLVGDLKILSRYVSDVIDKKAPVDEEILQMAYNICCNIPTFTTDPVFETSFLEQQTDVLILDYLNTLTKNLDIVTRVIQKANPITQLLDPKPKETPGGKRRHRRDQFGDIAGFGASSRLMSSMRRL